MSSNGVLTLTEARTRMGAVLAPVSADEPRVLLEVVEALDPPVIMLVWGEPWLEPQGFGPCLFDTRLIVFCIASRLEPGPGVQTLEEMVGTVVEKLRADPGYRWPQVNAAAPRIFRIGGVNYLGAQLTYRVSVTTESEVP